MEDQKQSLSLYSSEGKADAVLDTDAYNAVDDQFALAYFLRSEDQICPKAIYAAPFFNAKSFSPEDGMEKSYQEILKMLSLCRREDLCGQVFRGSKTYLSDEKTFVSSSAAEHLAHLADQYSKERRLYIISIGAITNVASAFLMNPSMKDHCVVVWLGGHGHQEADTKEFNLWQDVAAARVVFSSGVPLVQLPCGGVVDRFMVTGSELKEWLIGKNKLADYLAQIVLRDCGRPGQPWSKVIWDVAAVAWLTNQNQRFLKADIRNILLPDATGHYDRQHPGGSMAYVYAVRRDALMWDLFQKILREELL